MCVVPEGELSDLKTTYPERHVDIAQELVEKIEGKGVKEVKLKILGLRAVEVCVRQVSFNVYWLIYHYNRMRCGA